MKAEFTEDEIEVFAGAMERALERVLDNPAVLDRLAARLSTKWCWLTYEEARRVVGCKDAKWDRWLKEHRETGADGCPALVISMGAGAREPRVRMDSILAVMDFRATGEPALNGAQLLAGKP